MHKSFAESALQIVWGSEKRRDLRVVKKLVD